MWSDSTNSGRRFSVGNDGVAHNFGVTMSKRLGDGDAKAIDLVMGGGSVNSEELTFAAPAANGLEKRVRTVESILKLLAQMPAVDPPANLVARTLERIDQQGVKIRPGTRSVQPPVQNQSRHHA